MRIVPANLIWKVYNLVLHGGPMPKSEAGEVTRLLQSWSGGEKEALNELVPIVQKELRGLAAAYLRRERRDHTLQPTALVHEAYLRLVDQTQAQCRNRAQFFAIAANLMRQILVDHARHHLAAKRGGGNKVALEEAAGVAQRQEVDILALDEALGKLALLDPRQSQVVELRFFAGLTEDEIANLLDVAPITIKRDWRMARAVLHHELGGGVLG
jgi:RNA polymerase sigma factor (TIGR02999 family)